MSLLDIGAQCSHPHCTTIDFLPTLCLACTLPFCGAHISAHVTADSLSRTDGSGGGGTVCAGVAAVERVAGGSERQREEWALRVECEVEGCGRRAMEGVAGRTIEASETTVGADGAAVGQDTAEDREVAVIAKRIRCAGCGKAFCVSHRHPSAHSCPAPSPSDTRQAASAARHAHAQTIIAQHFPSRSNPLAAAPRPSTSPSSAPPASSATTGAKEARKAEDARWDDVRGGGMKAKREAIVAAHKAKRAAVKTSATATGVGSSAMSGGESSSSKVGTDKRLAISEEQADKSEVVGTIGVSPTSSTPTLPVTPGAPTLAPTQPTASSLTPPDSNPAQNPSRAAAPTAAPAQMPVQAPTRPTPNPKAEKLWALHVRKIKMAAAPLDPTSASSKAAAAALAPIASGSGTQPGAGASAGMKRFFEWAVGSAQEVRDWEAAGKWAGKGVVRRAWVPMDMSAGRALDLFLSVSKTPRPLDTATAAASANNNAPALGMALLNLSLLTSAASATSTNTVRAAKTLILSQSLSEQVEDGTLIVLVRDWPTSPV